MGRPRKQINPRLVEKLARIGCNVDEISIILECSKDTLQRRFAAEMLKGKENLKMRLRRKQVLVALRGNVAMLIWLGKQYLGQSDKQEVTERKIDYSTLTDEELEALASAESIG